MITLAADRSVRRTHLTVNHTVRVSHRLRITADDHSLVFFVRTIFRYDINLFGKAYAFDNDLSLLFYL